MDFTIIIPALNEKKRLPLFLSHLVDLIAKANLKGEIIVVDDGSQESDYQAYLDLRNISTHVPVTILKHNKNLGKGAAIKTGFSAAKGKWVGYVDADGAVEAQEVLRLLNIALSSDGLDGVLGSRILMLGYNVQRRFMRYFFGRIFATLVYFAVKVPLYDSQCGCKFFRKSAIMPSIELCREKGYTFDIELISLAYLNKLALLEVPINWHDVAGSKVRFMRDGLRMLASLWGIRSRWLRMKAKVG